ncbi:zinc finger protein ubi-d4 A [Toxorhynchites rutilus septentrionalis]|uniref:zinc finger protein ubi-d4 A n=1 Tax=Toxorhynchites rutilus septentrionalis TaxID=329112 RepID=UPI00247A35CA|nr:zinc finger protein ubi-d4 A [Toxorhynchites rutilus septentrionalis]
MASAGGLDIQVVSLPNLQKIENFMRDSTYKETLEISASFNTRLCLERRMRLPFFDSQTGVAQNHGALYMPHCKRMPGHREGQLYTYPSSRWRKAKRQYLNKYQNLRPFGNLRASGIPSVPTGFPLPVAAREPGEIIPGPESDFNPSLLEESSLGATVDTDSKDSHQNQPILKEEPLPKDWYYDEIALNDDDLDDPEGGDSDYDYNVNGYKRKGKRSKRSSAGGKRSKGNQSAAAAGSAGGDFEAVGSPGGGGSSRKGRPPGGSGSKRGRKKNPKETTSAADKVLEEGLSTSLIEPPSFESAAAAVDMSENGENGAGYGASADLRNYRKYL